MFTTRVVRDYLPIQVRKYLPLMDSDHLPLGFFADERQVAVRRASSPVPGNPTRAEEHECQGRLDHCLHVLLCCVGIIRSPERFTMMQTKGDEGIMVLKATNNGSYAANAEKSKGPGKPTGRKGSRVTEARAKAQCAKLDAQAESRQQQEVVIRQTQNKKSVRQDLQANRRAITTLIEAYLQDHIGGNHSEKTLEWHCTALGLMRLFLEEGLDITQGGTGKYALM